jgi:hypothetical protein
VTQSAAWPASPTHSASTSTLNRHLAYAIPHTLHPCSPGWLAWLPHLLSRKHILEWKHATRLTTCCQHTFQLLSGTPAIPLQCSPAAPPPPHTHSCTRGCASGRWLLPSCCHTLLPQLPLTNPLPYPLLFPPCSRPPPHTPHPTHPTSAGVRVCHSCFHTVNLIAHLPSASSLTA